MALTCPRPGQKQTAAVASSNLSTGSRVKCHDHVLISADNENVNCKVYIYQYEVKLIIPTVPISHVTSLLRTVMLIREEIFFILGSQ